MTNALHLHVKFEYFDQIKAGTKTEEYRLSNEYWDKRLVDHHYETVVIWRAYTSESNTFPWAGHIEKTITHPHFGPDPVEVYAIKLKVTT